MTEREKYALVTGCSEDSIGDAIVRELLKDGFHVIGTRRSISDKDRQRISDSRFTWVQLDVTSDAGVQTLASTIDRLAGGKLDMLVSNAGTTCTLPATDVEPALAEHIMSTNVVGAMRLVYFLHPQIVAAKGTIALMGSVCAVAPNPWLSVYNASKAALHQYGNTLRIEMEPLGVHVVVIAGGLIRTKFLLGEDNRDVDERSLYLPLKDHIAHTWDDQTQATAPETFAKDVVAALLRKNPPTWYWSGAFSSTLWTIATFLPHRAFDYLYNYMIPLKKLKAPKAVSNPN